MVANDSASVSRLATVSHRSALQEAGVFPVRVGEIGFVAIERIHKLYAEVEEAEREFWSKCELNTDGSRSDRKRIKPPDETCFGGMYYKTRKQDQRL